MLEAALTAGLCSIGAHVFHAGTLPSPAVAYLIRHYRLDAGIMISASHNAFEDNGIKFFNQEGFKLADSIEAEIEQIVRQMEQGQDNLPRPTGEGVGIVKPCPYALDDYASYLLSTVPGLRLDDLKIALDCANGAASEIAPLVFSKLGARVRTLSNNPDGININKNCGSTHLASLQEHVVAQNADIGLAFDGDADRMMAIDASGEVIDGDIVLAICGLDLHERGQLNKGTLVGTVMSNQGLEIFCRKHNIILHRTDVGDRYVLEKMLAGDLPIGGEQSGHIIFRQFSTTGDGLLTALQLLSVMVRKNQSASALAGIMQKLPQVLVNVTVPNHRKLAFSTHTEIQKVQADIESRLAGEGRILVRSSGTEPLVRVMIEGKDQSEIRQWAQELADAIDQYMND